MLRHVSLSLRKFFFSHFPFEMRFHFSFFFSQFSWKCPYQASSRSHLSFHPLSNRFSKTERIERDPQSALAFHVQNNTMPSSPFAFFLLICSAVFSFLKISFVLYVCWRTRARVSMVCCWWYFITIFLYKGARRKVYKRHVDGFWFVFFFFLI